MNRSNISRWGHYPHKTLEDNFQKDFVAEAIIKNMKGIKWATKHAIMKLLGGLDNNLQRSIAIAVAKYSKGLSLTYSKIEHVHELLEDFYNLIDNDVCHNNFLNLKNDD